MTTSHGDSTGKEFKIMVGLDKDHLIEVLHTTLKNDSEPEVFSLVCTDGDGVEFPSRYLKIIALT